MKGKEIKFQYQFQVSQVMKRRLTYLRIMLRLVLPVNRTSFLIINITGISEVIVIAIKRNLVLRKRLRKDVSPSEAKWNGPLLGLLHNELAYTYSY